MALHNARKTAAWCLFTLVFLCTARAQTPPAGRSGLTDLGLSNPIQELRQRLSSAGVTAGTLALEGAVDPGAYIVGPGDQFSLTTGGAVPVQMNAQVSADGSLVIPGVTSFDAAGQTLAVVKARAQAALQQQYRNVPVEVTLVQPRQFYVHVSGAVPLPNRYLAMQAARVSDVLEQAYAAKAFETQMAAQRPAGQDPAALPALSATSERPELHAAYRPSLRNVLLTRGGEQRSLDLFHYFTTGNAAHNPYLLDGDVITVPPYHTLHDALLIDGEVPYPGRIPYRPGDTVLDALLIAMGPEGLDQLGEVRLIRRAPDGQAETQLLNVKAMCEGEAPALALQAGDHLNVPARDRPGAAVYGLVHYPSTYPIQQGKTTLRDLIALAGGLKPDASVHAAYIERRGSNYFKGDGRVSGLDFFSRAYLQRELSQNRVVINLEEALQPGAEDFVLMEGDAVVFPRDEGTVFVTGNVPRPGYVAFVPGQDARYYVEAAGGSGPLTTGIYVFEAGTGSVRTGNRTLVRSGDTVFIDREAVPDSPEVAQLALSDAASRRQTRILTTQTIITGLSAITGIITAYVAITR